MSELAEHDLIDKYRDPKTGTFSFPGDVAKIIKKLEGDLAKERALCADIACASIMKFRSRVNGKYYPGYHEDMRDFVRTSIIGGDGGRKNMSESYQIRVEAAHHALFHDDPTDIAERNARPGEIVLPQFDRNPIVHGAVIGRLEAAE